MRPVDYLIDARDILLGRQPYKDSELAYLLREIRVRPRCYIGLHYPYLDNNHGRCWMDPGEPAWVCAACDREECYRLRDRFFIWLYEDSPFSDQLYDLLTARDKLIARLRGRYCERHLNWYEWPCEACKWDAEQQS